MPAIAWATAPEVSIDSVAFGSNVATRYQQLHITKMAVSVNGGKYTSAKRLRVKVGAKLSIRVSLRPYRGTSAVLAFDDTAADHYAAVLIAREQAGLPISTADAQIAAICRAHAATCATRNTKDFELTGIQLVDPWAA